jgi:thiopurine S-methyltransferase
LDPEFWHKRWARDEIGFHQEEFNALMQKYLPALGLHGGAHILVPLCGKSRDMLWLAGRGYRVTGIEISDRAAQDFFAENGLAAEVVPGPGGPRYRDGRIEIHVGDFFRFNSSVLPPVDGVYDRAALVALPRDMRKAYAAHLISLIPPGAPILLVTVDYPEAEMSGPPFPVSSAEVQNLFGDCFDIEQAHSESCLEREPRFREKGLTRMVERVHILRRRG